jgi:hypothetical protein
MGRKNIKNAEAEAKNTEAKTTKKNAERFEMLARLHGYNELARLTTNLGEKVYFRLFCKQIEAELATKYDVTITHTETTGATVLTLGYKPPFIVFTERDIEAMRVAVAEHDARKIAERDARKTAENDARKIAT